LVEAGWTDEQRREVQEKVNPVYVPRQHLLQIAIDAANKGDYSELHQLMSVLEKPFTEQEGRERYSSKPPEEMVRPGISMLSCSS
jgi:serine/tyrosine/threonine adenylyltransferase